MSDMCFDASERIARETDFRRAEIAQIDRFLARKHLREFKLQDARNCLKDAKLAESILDAFIGHKVVQKQERFYCPEHQHTVLEPPKRHLGERTGFCQKCDNTYALNGLDCESVFIRIKEPDRPLPEDNGATGEPQVQTEQKWWTDKKWLTEKVLLPVASGLLAWWLRGTQC